MSERGRRYRSGAPPKVPDVVKVETLHDAVARAKQRWLKRVMYETTASSTERCLAYTITDRLNCVTLDAWPAQATIAELLGFESVKTVQRASDRLEELRVLRVNRRFSSYLRYRPIFLPVDIV